MDYKLVKSGYVYLALFVGLICNLLYAKNTFAVQYKLELKIDLSSLKKSSSKALWLDPVSIPGSGGDFFIAQNNGAIYLINKENNSKPKTALNLPLSKHPSSFLSLSAIAIHPSFIRPEEPGYATLYTAHTVDFLQDSNTNRLSVEGLDSEFPFETVITAWQFDFDTQKIISGSSREVLRIPIREFKAGLKTWPLTHFRSLGMPIMANCIFH